MGGAPIEFYFDFSSPYGYLGAQRIDAIGAERGEEGERAPMAVRHLGDEPFAPRAAPVGTRHVGLHPRLVDEDQAGGIKPPLVLFSLCPPSGDVRAILLAGVQAFF